MEPKPPLIGERCILRDWIQRDLPIWRTWMQPGHAWKQLDAPYYPLPSDESLELMIESKAQDITNQTWIVPRTSLVIAERETQQLLGMVIWSWHSLNWPEIGIVIYDPAYWGQGIGTDALQMWCKYLWQTLPTIARLDLRTWSGNTGMQALARKLGFREEARFRKARVVNGEYYDSLGFGILREEWQQNHSPNE